MIKVCEGSIELEYTFIQELLQAHYDEVALHKDIMKLKPMRSWYITQEKRGHAFGVFAYDGDQVVGYSVMLIGPHHHYADLIVANNDVLFLHKDYRNGSTGLRLINESERLAKEYGAKLVLFHAKQGTSLEHIMPKIGYGVQDIVFSKEV